jgi:hypothetical protein
MLSGLTKKAEPPPTRNVNRDSGTDSANPRWLRQLVEPTRAPVDSILWWLGIVNVIISLVGMA